MADGSSPTERAGEVTCPTSPVRELLVAYHGVLDAVDGLPAVPFVLWTHADHGLPARLRYLPRPKWLLRLFVVRHFDASLALLARRYSAGAALGSLSETDLRDREAVKEFRQSLPPVRQVVCFVLLVVAVLAVARPLSVLLPKYVPRAAALPSQADLLPRGCSPHRSVTCGGGESTTNYAASTSRQGRGRPAAGWPRGSARSCALSPWCPRSMPSFDPSAGPRRALACHRPCASDGYSCPPSWCIPCLSHICNTS
jgi:hypothetical protein